MVEQVAEQIQISKMFVDVPNGSVFVQRWTPAPIRNSTPIVLLHDSLGCVETWKDFPQRLCETTGRTVIAYDRLGFGQSTGRTDLPSIQFIQEEAEIYLPILFKALNIHEFSLFGHSMGGGMAIVCASHFPDRCRAIVTESAQAYVEERTRQGILQAQKNFENPQVFAKLEKYHGSRTRWVLDAWIQVWLSPEFSDWTLEKVLPQVRSPMLVIHGDRDEYGSLDFPKMISQATGGPVDQQIIFDCGHVPHREKPDLILDLCARFFLND